MFMRSLLVAFVLLLALPASAQESVVVTPNYEGLDLSRITPGATDFTITVVQGPMRQPFGTLTRTVTVDEAAGEALFVTAMEMMGQKFSDSTRTDWPALTTRSHRSQNPQRRLDFDVADGRLTGEHQAEGAATEAFEMNVDGPIYDSSMLGELASLLPIAEGYTATVPAYEYEAGGLAEYTVRVLGSEKLALGGRTPVDTWVVEARRPNQEQVPQMYLSKEDLSLVRIRIVPQEGVEVLVDVVE